MSLPNSNNINYNNRLLAVMPLMTSRVCKSSSNFLKTLFSGSYLTHAVVTDWTKHSKKNKCYFCFSSIKMLFPWRETFSHFGAAL